MCVGDNVQGIDGSFEGVDLLVRISDQDFPTALREEHVHDGCEGGKEGGMKTPPQSLRDSSGVLKQCSSMRYFTGSGFYPQ